MAPSSTEEGDTPSLDDYSSFQYMLARPRVARAVVDRTASFVFYNEPRDGRKKEVEHVAFVRGKISFANYYCCCLAVLPSHVLGMSRWISAEDCLSSSNKAKKELQSDDTLRRFRYSYYRGLLHVETHHVFAGYVDNGKDPTFRVVEYMDCPLSPWVVVHVAFASLSLPVVYILQTRCGLPWFLGTAVGLISMHLLYKLTGVQMM